jgi:hypothetical protein
MFLSLEGSVYISSNQLLTRYNLLPLLNLNYFVYPLALQFVAPFSSHEFTIHLGDSTLCKNMYKTFLLLIICTHFLLDLGGHPFLDIRNKYFCDFFIFSDQISYFNFSLHFWQQLLVHTWWSAERQGGFPVFVTEDAGQQHIGQPSSTSNFQVLSLCVCVLHSAAELTQRSSLPWLPTPFLKYVFITSLIRNIFLHYCQATCAHMIFEQMPID